MIVPIVTLALIAIFLGTGLGVEYITTRRTSSDLEASTYAVLAGWGVASLVAVFVALTGAPLKFGFLAVCIAGTAGLLLIRPIQPSVGWLIGAMILLSPLLWISSRVKPTMFDEFAQWLPNVRMLVESDKFPDSADPNIWSAKPGYPPALSLVGYGVEYLAGTGFESAAKVFNVAIGGAFGLILAAAIKLRLGLPLALAIGVACATILNPFFDPRVALSVYADIPSGFVLALCVAAYAREVEEPDPSAWWRMAGPTVVLLLLRETGIVLVVGLGAGLLLFGRRGWRGLAILGACAVIAFVSWRAYLISAGIPSGLAPRPVADWDWQAPWTVARVLIGDRLANNPMVGSAALVVLVAGVCGAVGILCGNDARRRDLVLLCGSIAVVWVCFLAWSYVAVFSPPEVATAASTWRYLSELGPTFIYGGLVLIFTAIPGPAKMVAASDGQQRWIGGVACLLVPLSLLLTWKYWRFDCRYPDIAVVLSIVHPLESVGLGKEPMAIVHPTDGLGYATTLDYELHRPLPTSHAFTTPPDSSYNWLLDLTPIDRSALSKSSVRPALQLMYWKGDTWAPTLTIPSAPLPACSFVE